MTAGGDTAHLPGDRYWSGVVESLPHCVAVLDADGSIKHINQAGLRIFEADTRQQIEGDCLYRHVHEPLALQALNEAIHRGEPAGGVAVRLIGLKGHECSMAVTLSPIRDDSGTVTGSLCVGGANGLGHRSEQTAELLNRVGPILLSELDPQKLTQRITDIATQAVRAEFGALFNNFINEQGEGYLLYTLSGAPREAFQNFPMPRNTAVFGPTFHGEGVVRSDDITRDPRYGKNAPYFGTPKGHLPVISYLAVPVTSRTGKVVGGLFFGHSRTGVFDEESERIATGIAAQAAIALDNAALFSEAQRIQEALRRSNQELKLANEDLNQFAHSASHDLQEPLRTVSIYSQLLRRKLEGKLDSEAEEYIGYMVRGATRMEALVKDLLAFTQAANVSGDPSVTAHAGEALESALANLNAAVEKSGAEVTFGTLPVVALAHVHLTQLFQNLVGNAIKYRSERPCKVEIAASRQGAEWLFSVADNGIGIEERYTTQIFGLFKRLHTFDAYSGTGLGLAICQRIVERAGGRIWVESEVGVGSTFYFTLPG